LENEFGKLNRKLVSQALLIVCAAFGLGLVINYVLIDGVLEAPFANAFIGAYMRVMAADWQEAARAYRHIFRANKTVILFMGLFLLTALVSYLSLTRLTKYFREVSRGIDKLAAESSEAITLSPEMDFMERKINAVNAALRGRAKELRENENRKSELVMYLAHDIRTPMTSVIGYLSLLDENPDMPEKARIKYLRVALEKANRLEGLIEEFFEITRYRPESIAPDMRDIDLPFMLSQIKDELYPQSVLAGKTIAIRADENLTVRGHADALARVFINLLKNAVAYSEENSEITVSAFRENGRALITFKNRGNRIPESELGRIFEKFHRLDGARGSDTGGAGLGLAIAKEIAVLHGGAVSAANTDEGVLFTVSLPA
jgi:two-component system sensor histidine kinase VanS